MTADSSSEDFFNIEEVEQLEGVRVPKNWTKHLVPALAILWCLFQLISATSLLILDFKIRRSIHLAFALAIAFSAFPMFKKPKLKMKYLAVMDRIPIMDLILALLAAFCALYLVVDYWAFDLAKLMGIELTEKTAALLQNGFDSRIKLLPRDIFFSSMLVILLLEACRRVVGPALTIVTGVFIFYCFTAPHWPDFIADQATSLQYFISQVNSSEGIYGIPLGVSTQVVFLFVLFGCLLEVAGGGRYFIELAISLLGSFRGGPAKAAVVGSGLTGMISGSSIANIVTTGTFTIPLMKKVGYPAKKAAAIEVAASTDGQIAPPIMGAAAFIIAATLNISYLDVVIAATIPAFASYATLFYLTDLEACKLKLKGLPKEQLPKFWPTLIKGLYYIIPVVFLITQLMIFRSTPEKAAFQATIALLVIILIKNIVTSHKDGAGIKAGLWGAVIMILSGFINAARNMVPVSLACAGAGVIVAVVGLGLGSQINSIIEALSMGNIFLMLVIAALVSLMIGMGLPTTATYVVMAALTAPAIVEVGGAQGFIVPLIAAHLFCFYFGILADDTPPVGLASYAAAAIAKSPPIPTGVQAFLYDVRTAILPFMFIFNADIILHGIELIPKENLSIPTSQLIQNWGLAILILISTCLGNFMFAAATQNWFRRKNNWLETILLLFMTFAFMRPDAMAKVMQLNHDQRYLTIILPVLMMLCLFIWQGKNLKQESLQHDT
ncbi:MAG: TRAP transporter permease [Lentisphaeria bacterium]|nr:TRAP transporter permease [Lentisphaeria bacterium]